MEKLKRDIKLARKSVFYDFRAYVWFFAAIIIVQFFISSVLLVIFNGKTAAAALEDGENGYHMALKNLNADQYYLIINDLTAKYGSVRYFEIVRAEEHGGDGAAGAGYDLYIKFDRDDVAGAHRRFDYYYSERLRQYDPAGTWYEYDTPQLKAAESDPDGLESALFLTSACCRSVLCTASAPTILSSHTAFS